MEAFLARLVLVYVGFLDIEIPAMQAQLARGEPLLDHRVCFQVLHLLEHVELGELVTPLEMFPDVSSRVELPQALFAVPEPALQRRNVSTHFAVCERAHRTALRMAADDDVPDRQIRQGE